MALGNTNFGNDQATGTVGADGFLGPLTGDVTATFVRQSASNALTAVGTNRGTSLALTSAINVVSTAASGTGVTLPSAATVGIGGVVTIYNYGANPIQVYGAGSDTVDGAAAATGVPLANAKRCIYTVTAAATYISAQLGVVSA